MMAFLTKKQKSIYDYLKEYIGDMGYAPSIKEICDHFGTTSVSTMHKQLTALENKGLIRRTPKMRRAIELVDTKEDKPDITEIPIMGTFTEGAPIETVNMIEYIRLPERLSRGKRVYILEVKGDFFTGELIGDGDLVVIESKSEIEDGRIALIHLGKRNVTLRRVTRDRNKFILHSPGAGILEKKVDVTVVKILGVLIGVMRDYLES